MTKEVQELLYNIAYVVSILFETLIIYTFYSKIINKRKISKKGIFGVYAVFFILNSISIIVFQEQQLLVMLLIFISIALVSLFYECEKSKQVMSVAILMVVISLSEIIMGMILSGLLKISVGEIIDNIIYYTTGMLTSKFLAFLIVKIIGSTYRPNDNPLSAKLSITFLVLPFASILVGVVIIGAFGKNISNFMGIIGSISIVLLTGANMLVFYLFEKYSSQIKKQALIETEKEKVEREKVYLSDLIEKQNMSSRVMHDLKNKLFVIKSKFENNSEEALAIIDDICDIVVSKESIMYTKNEAIDALINSKKNKIDEYNIDFKCSSYIGGFGEVEDIDLCAIIGNLLDNAIEASVSVNEKFIQVNIRQANNCIIIEISNGVNEKIEIIDNKIETKKKDKANHGLGLKNIKDIVLKYNGTLNLECDDSVFKASVVLLLAAI